MMTFFFVWNTGLTWRLIEDASSSFDSLFLRAVSKWNRKIMDLIFPLYWHTKHDTYKTVFVQIIRAIVCGMVKNGRDILKYLPNFEIIVSSIDRKSVV